MQEVQEYECCHVAYVALSTSRLDTYPELLLTLRSHETLLALLRALLLQALAHLGLPPVHLILLPLGFLQGVGRSVSVLREGGSEREFTLCSI